MERWVHSIAQLAAEMCGDRVAWLVPGALQSMRPEERVAQPGQHAGGGSSQPRCMFTACEPRLPAAFAEQSPAGAGQSGQLAWPQKPAGSAAGVACRSRLCREWCHAASTAGAVLALCFGAMELTPRRWQGFCQPGRSGGSGPCPVVWQAGEDT